MGIECRNKPCEGFSHVTTRCFFNGFETPTLTVQRSKTRTRTFVVFEVSRNTRAQSVATPCVVQCASKLHAPHDDSR